MKCEHPDYFKSDGECAICKAVAAIRAAGGPGGKLDNKRERQAERTEQKRNNPRRRKYAH